MVGKLQTFIGKKLDEIGRHLSRHPIFGGIALMIAYFMFDYEFMGGLDGSLARDHVVLFSIFASNFAYYLTYLRGKLKEDLKGKEKRLEIGFFIALIILPLVIFYGYDSPFISTPYYKQEVIVLLVLAPIFEELAFRYLLYDKWAKVKYGKIIGGLLIGLIFIIAHPIQDLTGFVIYWLPTLFLFMTYDLGGVKGSIAAHMLFNIVAIL